MDLVFDRTTMNVAVRTALYAVYVAAVVIVNLPVVRGVVQLSRNDASASHLVVIPLVTLALVYSNRRKIFASLGFDLKRGMAFFALGIALMVLARRFSSPEGALTTGMAAVVVLSLAGFIASYGRNAFEEALFLLGFLALSVPIPSLVLDHAVSILKRGSTEAVAVLFNLTGTAFHREGYVFTLRDFVIEVANECSGIRSSIALTLTTLLAGHMFLRSTWKKTLLVLVVFPLTIFKNGIRIVTLSLLAMHVDPGFLTGQLHHEGGIVFFLLALVLLSPLFLILVQSDAGVASQCKRDKNVPPSSSEALTV
jgi:exosortase